MKSVSHVKCTSFVHGFTTPSFPLRKLPSFSLLIYVANAHFAKFLVDFKSPHIYWTKQSWLMDSINLITSKTRRERMFMRSIITIEHHWKQQHYWKMKAHLSCALFFFIPEDSAGLSSHDANDVLPSVEISHQSVYKPPFPVIIPLRQQW